MAQRVTTSGFTDAEKSQLRALGATDAEIVNLRTWFDREFDIVPGVTLDSTLLEIADGFDAAVGAIDAFARQVSAVVVDGASVNARPVAQFDATPTTGVAPLNVSFDGTASSDSDGTIVSYEWNFGDASTGSGPTVGHVYTTAGSYTASLKVTDDAGGIASTSTAITVTSGGGPNTDPTAAFVATPLSGAAPLVVSFDVSASVDAEGPIVSYDWDFGGLSQASGLFPSYTFETPGEYDVTLTVTDADGAVDTETQSITVSEPDPTNQHRQRRCPLHRSAASSL